MAGQLSQFIINLTQEGQDYIVKGNKDGRSTQPPHIQPHTGGTTLYQIKGKPLQLFSNSDASRKRIWLILYSTGSTSNDRE